ncbi:DUF3224 domain-containing protein [Actinokineospora cianjurensis]|uniref:Uncharacterized protein DUF3224 n=1 Tax=Actinokineospora cianjurensis TaxID=585224 RepID=A0A421AZG1_9PSEU|nr:DUF3224 domain-containing protein [Actinokineospora cianjurensis]RLK55216.1 uncharacterized protein DUF3224 [Actinokineospora cianjurensis]
MRGQASGTFTVDAWEPESPYDQRDGVDLGHTVLRKTFSGGLAATSEVHMTSAVAAATGAAAYVAIERVEGTLDGRTGSFVLLHSATSYEADSSERSLTVAVVAGTGAGELSGLTGTLRITKTGDEHQYDLEYTLP